MSVEIAQVMKEKGRMFEWADKIANHKNITNDDKEISKVLDVWAKDMGEYGSNSKYTRNFAQFMTKIVNPEIHNAEDSLIMPKIFDENQIGEFDDISIVESPTNTLVAHETTRGGNVDKSYIDYSRGQVFRKFLQVETELKFSELRKGSKSIADLSNFAVETLNNQKFATTFNVIDSLITVPSEQGFNASGGLTQGIMDEAAGYIFDRGTNPMLVGLSTDMRGINKMSGYDAFYSESMKNALNMNAILGMYSGVTLAPVNASWKTGDGNTLLPQGTLFGISDTIGTCSMIGNLRTYVTADNNAEKYYLKFTGYEFMFNIIKPEKICKINLK